MDKLKLSLFFLLTFWISGAAGQKIQIIGYGQIAAMPKVIQQKKARKFPWKKIFRPVKIFRKRISFWLKLSAATFLGLGFLFHVIDKSDLDLEGVFFEGVAYFFLSIFVLAVLFFAVLIIAFPIVILIRIFKEIKFGKRFRKCFKF